MASMVSLRAEFGRRSSASAAHEPCGNLPGFTTYEFCISKRISRLRRSIPSGLFVQTGFQGTPTLENCSKRTGELLEANESDRREQRPGKGWQASPYVIFVTARNVVAEYHNPDEADSITDEATDEHFKKPAEPTHAACRGPESDGASSNRANDCRCSAEYCPTGHHLLWVGGRGCRYVHVLCHVLSIDVEPSS